MGQCSGLGVLGLYWVLRVQSQEESVEESDISKVGDQQSTFPVS